MRASKRLSPLLAMALAVFACNQITGESSLTFDGGDDGGACGSLDYSGDCQTCLQANCCSQASACSGDSGCTAFQQCVAGCGPGNQSCYTACVKDNQCALPLGVPLLECLGTACAASCAAAAAAPDAGTCLPVEYGVCNQNSQCGCPKGQNCVVSDVAGDTSCVAAGAGLDNAPCTEATQCALGFACQGGACLPFCATDANCTKFGAGSRCYEAGGYVDACSSFVPVPGEGVCSSDCDPLDPKAVCGPALTCHPSGETSFCAGPTGTGTGPNGCSASSNCAIGYDCITYTAGYGNGTTSELQRTTCEPYCRISYTDCPSTQTCTPLSGSPSVDGVAYGVCTINCNLVTGAGCPTGSSCLPSSPQGQSAFTDCVQTGTAIGADGCAATGFNCAPGYFCDSGTCTKYCRTNSDCPSGSCTQFSPPFSVEGVTYGSCE